MTVYLCLSIRGIRFFCTHTPRILIFALLEEVPSPLRILALDTSLGARLGFLGERRSLLHPLSLDLLVVKGSWEESHVS